MCPAPPDTPEGFDSSDSGILTSNPVEILGAILSPLWSEAEQDADLATKVERCLVEHDSHVPNVAESAVPPAIQDLKAQVITSVEEDEDGDWDLVELYVVSLPQSVGFD